MIQQQHASLGRSRTITFAARKAYDSGKPKTNNAFKALNENQGKYIDMLNNSNKCIVVAHGPAGTGKTKCCVETGVRHLVEGKTNRLVITRPAIPVDNEQHGFLPGSLDQKLKPWLLPIFDNIRNTYNDDQVLNLMENNLIEIAPLAFMRGRTFDNAWIILDEGQNCTSSQMLMVLTRIGKNSKLVITGDPQQHDRGFQENGLSDLLSRLERSPASNNMVGVIEFNKGDIERHAVIADILDLYESH
jgi:phosphate starvation-inducible protein PhoH and related proteins